MKHITDKNGNKYEIDFYCTIENGKTTVLIKSKYGYDTKTLSVYYRPERTLDDHMGNTPCGYYVNIPLKTGEKKRVYMF